MTTENFGLKIGLEGEKEFKSQLNEINQSFKVLGSEMKLVESQFDKNDNSAQALTARNEVLEKSIEAQKGKIFDMIENDDFQTRQKGLSKIIREIQVDDDYVKTIKYVDRFSGLCELMFKESVCKGTQKAFHLIDSASNL